MEIFGANFSYLSDVNFYYVAAIAYLLGCIPFAIVVGHFGGIGDIRKLGSGNPGATNMARQGGKKLGAITLLLDAGKGALAVYIGHKLGYPIAAALFVVLGHCFSAILKFKGGKGVATTLGALLALSPTIGGIYLGLWILIFVIFRISSLSALVGIWLTALITALIGCECGSNAFALLTFLAVLITIRHKSNIKKLIAGTEN